MSIITIKISKLINLQYITDNNEHFKVRLIFKFTKNNDNWLYLDFKENIAKKLQKIFNIIIE